jgi:hypothetical protein
MNIKFALVASIVLSTACTAAMAAPGLTPQQCNSYPFVRTNGQVTHAQLMQELAELEAVGYEPGMNDVYYPRAIQRAERKLQAEYRQDCRPAMSQAPIAE